MGKGTTVEAPDPKKTSRAQTSTNIGTGIANNIMGMMEQQSPEGRISYEQTGSQSWTDPYTGTTYDLPTYKSTEVLNPTAQKAFDQGQLAELNMARLANSQSAFLKNYLGDEMSADNLPQRGVVPDGDKGIVSSYAGADDFSKDRRRVERVLMNRMRGQQDRDRAALEASLVNRGVNIGSEAYSDAQSDFSRGVNDARMSAILAAGDEQQRLVDMARDAATFRNAAQGQGFAQNLAGASQQDQQRGQALEELFAFRNQPINEITALLSNSQVAMPNFSTYTPSRVPTTDVAGNIWQSYNAKAQNAAQQNAAANSFWGNLIGAGGRIATLGI